MSLSRHIAAVGLLAWVAAGAAVQAQTVYRIVGPDGRVTFSDRPPVEPNAKARPATVGSGNPASDASLPFELRQVASRYPVTLYSAPNCGPCDSGRSFLSGRGIPFAERTVTTQQDFEALGRLSGNGVGLPLLTVGSQQLKGYSEAEWSQFLDAAGYPRTSQLPSGYRQQAAAPLVVVQQPAAPNRQAANQAPREDANATQAPAAGEGNPNNPAGIRF